MKLQMKNRYFPSSFPITARVIGVLTTVFLALVVGAASAQAPTALSELSLYRHGGFNYFYLTSNQKDKYALATLPEWDAESLGVFVASAPTQRLNAPLHRFFFLEVAVSKSRGSHFYTSDERDVQALRALNPSNESLVGTPIYEGIAAYVALANGGRCLNGDVPVYRAFRGQNNFPDDPNHIFTPISSRIDELVMAGWASEGVAFCASRWQVPWEHLKSQPGVLFKPAMRGDYEGKLRLDDSDEFSLPDGVDVAIGDFFWDGLNVVYRQVTGILKTSDGVALQSRVAIAHEAIESFDAVKHFSKRGTKAGTFEPGKLKIQAEICDKQERGITLDLDDAGLASAIGEKLFTSGLEEVKREQIIFEFTVGCSSKSDRPNGSFTRGAGKALSPKWRRRE